MSSRGRCPTASKVEINIGGSRPSDKGKPGHPDPEKKSGGGGGSQKQFYQPFGPQFGLKIRGWGGGEVPLEPSHGSTTDQGG